MFRGFITCAFFVLCGTSGSAQTLKGRVTDLRGMGVPNASVTVRGAVTGATTNESGYYEIPAAGNATLVFSSIGYLTREEPVSNRTLVNIVLEDEATKSLNEVIVVGYGSKKRSDVTGSVASVPKERLSQLPVTNVLHAIEGSVPGVNVTQTSSVPGSSADVLVRGQNSMSAGTGPFIVVDGIPLS